METYYKKVEMKSDADFPKKAGEYYAHCFAEPEHYIQLRTYEVGMRFWNTVEWYLLPVEEHQNVKSAEEILKKVCGYITLIPLDPTDDITVGEALEAIVSYHSQFTQQRQVSDEDIENSAKVYAGSNYNKNHFPRAYESRMMGYISGANDFRNNKIKSK